MKALVHTEYGSPDVLRLADIARPAPGPAEVLIAVRAASVNSWDCDLVSGTPFIARLAGGGLFRPKITILGADVAGQVVEVGAGVTGFRVGDAVFGDLSGCGWGGFAEYVCAEAGALALIPDGLGFEAAAATPQAAALALQGLRRWGGTSSGQAVLINGAGGGVGTFAVQLAKAFGAEVTGVDHGAKLGLVRSLGADHVIDYTSSDFTAQGRRYDLILDMVANRTLGAYRRSLTPTGGLVVVGGSTGTILRTVTGGAFRSRPGRQRLGLLAYRVSTDDLSEVGALIAAGTITPVIDRAYPLAEGAAAIRHVGEGRALGKVIVTP